MPIQQGIYVIRRNVVGIDNVIATGDGINDPILGLPNDQPDAQRVCFLNICRYVLRLILTLRNHSGRCAQLVTTSTRSSNPDFCLAHLEVSG